MIRYAVVIRDDPELFGYIDTELAPTGSMLLGMLLDMLEGDAILDMIRQTPPDHFSFHALH